MLQAKKAPTPTNQPFGEGLGEASAFPNWGSGGEFPQISGFHSLTTNQAQTPNINYHHYLGTFNTK